MKRKKGSLEIKVQAKKKNLELERKSLENKIRVRKKELGREEIELEEKAKALEKFQKITLDRELKMKELEKKLAQFQTKPKP